MLAQILSATTISSASNPFGGPLQCLRRSAETIYFSQKFYFCPLEVAQQQQPARSETLCKLECRSLVTHLPLSPVTRILLQEEEHLLIVATCYVASQLSVSVSLLPFQLDLN